MPTCTLKGVSLGRTVGYATKGSEDENKLYSGERDRVMSDTEEGAIRKVLVKKEEHLIFTMALETAMRLSEMFTLKRKTSTSKS